VREQEEYVSYLGVTYWKVRHGHVDVVGLTLAAKVKN